MANLEFHPFQDGFSINSTNAPGFAGNIGDRNQLVSDTTSDSVSSSGRKSNFFSMGFYQQFFDVETDQVLKRVLNSVIPTNNNFILDFVHPMPDLWGPFWISVTLVFSIGVFGNIAQYIENEGSSGQYGSDFRLVTSSATLVTLYVVLVPVLLSTILWQRKSEMQYAVSDLLCAYGYSLSIFVPVSILWTLDVNWFRWVLIIAAVSLSGAVLARALWPAFKTDPNKLVAYGSIFGVLVLHFLLAFTFKVYFFDATHPHLPKPPVPVVSGANASASQNSNSQVLQSEKMILLVSTPSPLPVSNQSNGIKENNVESKEVTPVKGNERKESKTPANVAKEKEDKKTQATDQIKENAQASTVQLMVIGTTSSLNST